MCGVRDLPEIAQLYARLGPGLLRGPGLLVTIRRTTAHHPDLLESPQGDASVIRIARRGGAGPSPQYLYRRHLDLCLPGVAGRRGSGIRCIGGRSRDYPSDSWICLLPSEGETRNTGLRPLSDGETEKRPLLPDGDPDTFLPTDIGARRAVSGRGGAGGRGRPAVEAPARPRLAAPVGELRRGDRNPRTCEERW